MPSRPDRWSQYDSVSYRTGGMERVGYDADTRRYYFQEGTELYEGQPGAEFGGQMRHIGRAPRRETNTTPYAATPKKSAWRRVSPLLSVIVRKASLKTRQSPKTTAAQSETPVMESPETATVESPETATVESPETATD